jgi:uncharacterized protein
MAELAKPGRDPREQFEAFSFTEGVNGIGDLKVGMKLPGIVTNITNFGAFVDIGVHQDGLVHLSQITNRYIKDPNEVLKGTPKGRGYRYRSRCQPQADLAIDERKREA